MKHFVLLLALTILPIIATATSQKDSATKQSISSLMSQHKGTKGVEVTNVGKIGISLLKSFVKLNSPSDPEAKEFLELVKDIDGIMVLNYEEADSAIKKSIDNKLSRILKDEDLILEASDNEEKVRIYATISNNDTFLSDITIYTPSESTVICFSGLFSVETATKLANK